MTWYERRQSGHGSRLSSFVAVSRAHAILPQSSFRCKLVDGDVGAGVIWNGDPLEPPVIPAKAGIQSDDSTFAKVRGVDSRFRGND